MTTLFLARHGQTDWNLAHRWQGDPPLNDTGRAQARALAESLAAIPLDGIYSSDLARARETAEIAGGLLGLEVEIDPRLGEIDVGEWVGHSTAELEELYPAGFQRYREGRAGWEQGESYEAMIARVEAAFDSIEAAHPHGRYLLATHAGVMCAAWLASGRELAAWEGTHNGDVHEILIEHGEISWIGVAQHGERHNGSKPSIFWRVSQD
ncbi:MAG TPA: histidine phosphatase family protein [Gaiellaceae bacterium]|nr:histidine phosphatase family protein [Gaiellaceae bacterium]